MNAACESPVAHPDDFLPRAPSDRDQRIYFEVAICSRNQADVAAQFELSQGRVSQIMKEVAAWRADATPIACGALAGKRRQRLARSDTRERLERLLEQTSRELGECDKPDVVRREGAWDNKAWHSTTTGRSRSTVQLLKLSRNLTLDLAELDAEAPPPAQVNTGCFQAELHKLIRTCMADWQKRGELPNPLPEEAVNDVLKSTMQNMLNVRPNTAIGQALDAELESEDDFYEAQAAVCEAAVLAGCAGVDLAGTKPGPGELPIEEEVATHREQVCSRLMEVANTPGANISGPSAAPAAQRSSTTPCQKETCGQSPPLATAPPGAAKKPKSISYGGPHSSESDPIPVGVPNHPPDLEFEEFREKMREYYVQEKERQARGPARRPPHAGRLH